MPACKTRLQRRGLVLSQFRPGLAADEGVIPMRNAVMSGYALATLVVEAHTAAAPASRRGLCSNMAATCSCCAACSNTTGHASTCNVPVSPSLKPSAMCSTACSGSHPGRRTSSGPDPPVASVFEPSETYRNHLISVLPPGPRPPKAAPAALSSLATDGSAAVLGECLSVVFSMLDVCGENGSEAHGFFA